VIAYFCFVLVDVFINQGEGKYCDIHHVDNSNCVNKRLVSAIALHLFMV